jgi:four helix bundle protein
VRRKIVAGTSAIQSFKDLVIWQRGMTLVESCYRLTKRLPDDERFGLISQIRRAAVSIPANIAEGHGREVAGSFIQHLRIAQGSLKELETLLMLVQRMEMAETDVSGRLLSECDELGRMLRSMIRAVQDKQ